jgi:hypothetical protein
MTALWEAVEVFGSPKEDYTRRLLAAAPGQGFAFGGDLPSENVEVVA